MLKRIIYLISIVFIYSLIYPAIGMTQQFIQIKEAKFVKGDVPYHFLGTNLWHGMNLGNAAEPALQARLIRELDHLAALGITNLRIMAASEGPDTAPWRMSPSLQYQPGQYNEQLLIGLDFLLSEMAKRNMQAVLCLNNMWPWSGGFAQYVNWTTGKPIPYPPPAKDGKWVAFMRYSAQFFRNKDAQELYKKHIELLINRSNSISGIPYQQDPTIMAWQLANEPRPILGNRFYKRWIRTTAAFIKSMDPNHLVSIGSEGNAFVPLSNKFRKEHRIKNIDYATIHIWIQNWGWYDPTTPEKDFQKALIKAKKYIFKHAEMAKKLKMPLVLEEFGIARDNGSYAPESTTKYRDQYYQEVFSYLEELRKKGYPLAGSNFWAWSGEGRPRKAKAIWKKGDDFTGDPPFEHQGWYSIYDKDVSTIRIIKDFTERINKK